MTRRRYPERPPGSGLGAVDDLLQLLDDELGHRFLLRTPGEKRSTYLAMWSSTTAS
jgi:hypothetical protein